MSPGPAVLLAINNGLSFDHKAVLLSALGNILGLFILSAISMLGVGYVLKASSTFFMILKFTGAAYLIYLGIGQIFYNDTKKVPQKHACKEKTYDNYKIFKKGFLLAISNPKPILFFTAIFPLFMNEHFSIVGQFFIMTFTFMSISLVSLIFYGWISGTAKVWLMNKRNIKMLNRFSGSLFVIMGIGMLFLEQDTKKISISK